MDADARRVLERHRADVVLELPPVVRRRIDQPRGQSRRVLEEIADGHRVAVRAAPVGEERVTGSSSRSAPVRTSSITTVVVAIGLVSDARSNGVSIAAAGASRRRSAYRVRRSTSSRCCGRRRLSPLETRLRDRVVDDPARGCRSRSSACGRRGRRREWSSQAHEHGSGGADEHVPGEGDRRPPPDDGHRDQPASMPTNASASVIFGASVPSRNAPSTDPDA